jgi:integrase
MPQSKKPATWSKLITEHGVTVRIFERAGIIYRSVKLGRVESAAGNVRTKQNVRSLGHGDRTLAEEQARELCEELKVTQLTEAKKGKATLGEVFAAYRQHRLPNLSRDRQSFAESRLALFAKAWGRDLPLSHMCQAHADKYTRLRKSGELIPPGIARQERASYAVRNGTIDSDFRWLASVFNWARSHKVGERRLLPENPMDDMEWQKEKNKRRPVATHARFLRTLEHADAVDAQGRFRCILTLARHTGRREAAVCSLRLDSLLLSQDRIAARLAELGKDEGLAAHMPAGAIHWRGETDKEGVDRVTPLSSAAREAVDVYLRRYKAVGAVPLFPSNVDAMAPVTTSTATAWLLRAEKRAGLPKLAGGMYHPYRRLWASERAHMPDMAVAEGGGWKSADVMRASYQRASPEALLAAVEGR